MGGNVFAGKTGAIKREHITSTLEAYFSELTVLFPNKTSIFNETYFLPLGSVGKKEYSGDIDLGIDIANILDQDLSDNAIAEWGIDPAKVQGVFNDLKKRARTSTNDQLRLKAFLKCLTIYINDHAPTLYCDEKKVSTGNLFGLYPQLDEHGQEVGAGVQIDWMIGNIDWLKFSYYSSVYPNNSNVKGLHRTQLILSLFQIANLSFNHVSGVKDKSTEKVVATSPVQALSILSQRLGFDIIESDTENYYTLHNLLKLNLKPGEYVALLNVYFKILDSTRADIPDNLQAEWINRKDQLGLTGKFLPDNSALKEIL
jgi:hypothetical protein